ncbi:MAG TPA: hypothetical protein VF736_03470 [Pyrinomonadaceae bacterium]|jgi:hypothetical protein
MSTSGLLCAAALACALWASPSAAQEQKEGSKAEPAAETKGGEDKRGKLKIEPDQRYLLLATIKTSTMQRELDEAAAQGFRS